MTAAKKFRQLLQNHSEYDSEGYSFLYEALDWAVKRHVKHPAQGKHVSGAQLCDGVCECALEQFGLLAKAVLEYWGIKTFADIGQMVFYLIDQDLMGKTDADTIESFNIAPSLADRLDAILSFKYDAKKEVWQTSYRSRVTA